MDRNAEHLIKLGKIGQLTTRASLLGRAINFPSPSSKLKPPAPPDTWLSSPCLNTSQEGESTITTTPGN